MSIRFVTPRGARLLLIGGALGMGACTDGPTQSPERRPREWMPEQGVVEQVVEAHTADGKVLPLRDERVGYVARWENGQLRAQAGTEAVTIGVARVGEALSKAGVRRRVGRDAQGRKVELREFRAEAGAPVSLVVHLVDGAPVLAMESRWRREAWGWALEDRVLETYEGGERRIAARVATPIAGKRPAGAAREALLSSAAFRTTVMAPAINATCESVQRTAAGQAGAQALSLDCGEEFVYDGEEIPCLKEYIGVIITGAAVAITGTGVVVALKNAGGDATSPLVGAATTAFLTALDKYVAASSAYLVCLGTGGGSLE
jgi:hypothetical protein